MINTLNTSIGGSDSNSYVTVEEADLYMNTRLHQEAWVSLSTPKKKAALIWATRQFETLLFKGQKVTSTQALAWPRKNAKDAEGVEISETALPKQLKYAVIEQAFTFAEADTTVRDSSAQNLRRVVADDVEVEFFDRAGNTVTTTPLAASQWLNGLIDQNRSSFRGYFRSTVRA